MFIICTVACMCVIFAITYKCLKSSNGQAKDLNGPLALPIIGHLYLIGSKSLHLFLRDLFLKYGDVFLLKLGMRNSVVLCSRESIREAYIKKAIKFAGRPNLPTFMRTMNNQLGLSLCDYSEAYKKNRQAVVRAMHKQMSDKKLFGKRFDCELGKMTLRLNQFFINNERLSPLRQFEKIVPSIFFSLLFGVEYSYDDTEFIDIVSTYKEWFENAEADNLIDYIPFLENFKNKRLDIISECSKKMDAFALKLINMTNNNHTSFSQHLKCGDENLGFEKENKANAKIIADIVGGGLDTISSTLSWGLLYLGNSQTIVEKCRREISSLPTTVNQFLTVQAYKTHMPFFSAVIYEILRYSCVAPLGLVRKTMEDTSIHGHSIKKGSIIIPHLWLANRDPKIWKYPDEFNPENFLNSNDEFDTNALQHLYSFSIGVRGCPGKDIAINIMFEILKCFISRYDIDIVDPPEDMFPLRGLTLKPKLYHIKLKKASNLK